ncbi:MAG: urate hydroxylase PuuD [Candidatus Binatia bacterium]
MTILESLLRWTHVVAGIIWIGHLYFFNWVNGPFQGTLDGPTKKAVNPQLLPRALYWFRWGAAWTWVTGVLLVLLVFYHGGIMFDDGGAWGPATFILLAITFLAFLGYDQLFKTDLGKDLKKATPVVYAIVAIIVLCMQFIAHWGYRAVAIHVGTMFGTIMAANVWMRIWPAQRKIILAVREGQPPDATLVALAGARSRHNTYMSVPLVWMMLNTHTTWAAGGMGWLVTLVMIALGWATVAQLYKKAGTVPGF